MSRQCLILGLSACFLTFEILFLPGSMLHNFADSARVLMGIFRIAAIFSYFRTTFINVCSILILKAINHISCIVNLQHFLGRRYDAGVGRFMSYACLHPRADNLTLRISPGALSSAERG